MMDILFGKFVAVFEAYGSQSLGYFSPPGVLLSDSCKDFNLGQIKFHYKNGKELVSKWPPDAWRHVSRDYL
jgi:hypothetical protein